MSDKPIQEEDARTLSCDNPKVAHGNGRELRVRDIMVPHPKTVPADGTVADLHRLFANPHITTALLVDGSVFAGAIDREELPIGVHDDRPAREFARQDVDSIDPDAAMTTALARMDAAGRHRLVVLDPDGRTLRGLLCLTPDRTAFCQSPRDLAAVDHQRP